MVANLIASAVVEEIEPVSSVCCYLLSQIGQPVAQPQIIDVQLQLLENQPLHDFQGRVEEIVADHLFGINQLWQRFIEREFTLY